MCYGIREAGITSLERECTVIALVYSEKLHIPLPPDGIRDVTFSTVQCSANVIPSKACVKEFSFLFAYGVQLT